MFRVEGLGLGRVAVAERQKRQRFLFCRALLQSRGESLFGETAPALFECLHRLLCLPTIIDRTKRTLNLFWVKVHRSLRFLVRVSFSLCCLFYGAEAETASSTSWGDVTGVWFGWSISKLVCCQMQRLILTPEGAACWSCVAQVW